MNSLAKRLLARYTDEYYLCTYISMYQRTCMYNSVFGAFSHFGTIKVTGTYVRYLGNIPSKFYGRQ